ncbi:unnamed protein product [Allacma fusca]|uniref:AAA+ ATPase domain-containing protein n=1 Tax=Allacma fusca TaxID=39272 RepID=A0A8J2L9F1_9HEXA|nr:unnamed protein product [Allacma fusca]
MESCMTTVPTASTFNPAPQLLLSKANDNERQAISAKKLGNIEMSQVAVPAVPFSSFLPNNNSLNGHGPPTYHIYDGFATVRKRKGPSCASIALRQQQEHYDLAEPASYIAGGSFPNQQQTANNPKTIAAPSKKASGGSCVPLKSNQLPSKNRNQIEMSGSNSTNGIMASCSKSPNEPLIFYSKSSSSSSLKYAPMNTEHFQRNTYSPWDTNTQHYCCSCNTTDMTTGAKQMPPCICLSAIHSRNSPPNGSEELDSGRPRLKSSSSLSRKIRRLVLPNKLFPPTVRRNNNNKTDKDLPDTISQTRLRTSVSDNSIANSSSTLRGGVPGDHSNSILCHSNSQTRSFHRSCMLPKPPLETVMEDGIPWRPRKDVPWWELATKRYRYRSCPVLQATHQAHVVAAFEQSLSNMTQRLQSLSASAEQKDSEVTELRKTIELLRKQSIEAGLTSANFTGGTSRDGSPIGRQLSADSVSSINSISSACSGTSHSHASGPSGQVLMTPLGTPTHHGTNVAPDSPNSKKKHNKNKGWLRSSFTKAFSRSKTNKTRNMSPSDVGGDDCIQRPLNLNGNGCDGLHMNGHYHPHHNLRRNLDDSAPASPTLTSPHGLNTHSGCLSNGCSSSSGSHSPRSNGHVKGSGSTSGLCDDFPDESASVDDLKKQLREKEMVLTDIRLEALTSAHQLESFKETVNKMRSEMLSLKQDNERLQRMVGSKSLTSSQTSLQIQSLEHIDRRLSASEVPGPGSIDVLLTDGNEKDGKRITITAFLGCHGSHLRYLNATEEFPASECTIGNVLISSKIKWDTLDTMVKKVFKEYVMRVDSVTNLGLNADSIGSYSIGEITRSKESVQPDLLPCGYLVGDVSKIQVCLRGAANNGSLDALAFETLIPKSILQRYVSLLLDHGRMILCGPSGTGKSYLARKLGEFIVARSGKDPCPEAIATFSADHKNSKELRQYLTNLAEQCESSNADLPSVIILDNLHQISSFGEVFNGFLHSKQPSSPIIIGTMGQSSSTCANLPLHHNFRWVLFGNHMDPVKGFLSRYLQRRLIEVEVQNGIRSVELARIIDWIPKVWHHVNKFLEIYNSSDATIGPRIFLSCPTDVANSQVWFTDLWHYSIVPYLIEAVKEGIQLYGKKAAWEDPTNFLMQTYPWTESHSFTSGKSSLQSVRAEDVGYDKGPNSNGNKVMKPESNDTDPLMNMLMRLQEAANYSGPQSNDSDTTSLDSHSLDSKDYTAAA